MTSLMSQREKKEAEAPTGRNRGGRSGFKWSRSRAEGKHGAEEKGRGKKRAAQTFEGSI